MTEYRSYEDEFGAIRRRLRRVWRGLRWLVKGLVGLDRTILVETRWRLGDEIMALPVYETLRAKYPRCRIEVLCNYPELLEGNAAVSAVNPKAFNPDRYVLLRGAPRDMYRLEHCAWTAGITTPRDRPRLHALDESFVPELPEGKTALVALAAGATWQTKRWPAGNWRRLGEALTGRGYRIVEMGVEGETIGLGANLVGRTTVSQAAGVLKHADLLICSDSGLMHLALAVGTPVLALFGPTDPSILIRNEPLLHVLTNGRDCQGCWNISLRMTEPGVCPLQIPCCMESLAPAEVFSRAESVLRRGRRSDARSVSDLVSE